MFWFNHHYMGSWLRDAHAYWQSNPFDNFSRVFGLRCALGIPDYNQDMNGRGNLLFYLREIGILFTSWRDLKNYYSPFVRPFIFGLTAIAILGVVAAIVRSCNDKRARNFVCFGAVTIAATLLFYSLCEFRASRYIVPIAPFFAVFFGVGVVDTMRWLWRRRITATLILPLVVAVAIPLLRLTKGKAIVVGDLPPVARILQKTSETIEPNAFVITSIYPPLVEHFVIRHTQRQIILLNHKHYYRIQPRPPKDPSKIPQTIANTYDGDLENGAVDIFEFSAMEDLNRLQELLELGTPVYVIDASFGHAMENDLRILGEHFDLKHVGFLHPTGLLQKFYPSPGPFLLRLKLKQADSTAQ
jgi:hypothetical protein